MTDSPSRASAPARLAPTAHLFRVALGGALAIFLLWVLGHVLLLVFAAILLAVALHGGATPLRRLTGWPHALCLGLIVVIVFAVLGTGVTFGGGQLAEQGSQLWEQLLVASEAGQEWLKQFEWGRVLVDGTSAEDVADDGGQLLLGFGSALVAVLTVVAGLVIAVVAAFYFALAPKLYTNGFLRLLPKPRRARAGDILVAIGQSLRLWLMAQGLAMLLVMITSFIGLIIIGVPMASLLALIAGITNFIPYIGPFIGYVPALLVAFSDGPQMALWVTVLFAGIQFLEGNVIEPVVQRRITRLPPVLTILSQTVMGTLFGILGVVLATPLLAAVLVGVRMGYVEDVLGDHRET